MREYKSLGTICVKDNQNFIYAICTIEYVLFEDEKFKYTFTPNYSVIDLLDSEIFQGIPGLNLDLRKDKYVRENINPTFISERVPSKNREDYYELLNKVNMEYMDPIKYLILTDMQYFGDNLFVIPYKEKKIIEINNKTNNLLYIKQLLENICLGNNIFFSGEEINDSNRKIFHIVFLELYKKEYNSYKSKQKIGIEKAKQEGKYRGRKPIKVDILKFIELEENVNNKKITRQQLIKELGISKDKYYRIKKSCEKK
ncbi:MAG: hypothetical protein K5765_09255 [Clostridia bacterium]|nr:hypothetical protein [Clostridia bacterium]